MSHGESLNPYLQEELQSLEFERFCQVDSAKANETDPIEEPGRAALQQAAYLKKFAICEMLI